MTDGTAKRPPKKREPLLPAPPDGFTAVDIGGTFAANNGPLFARWHDNHIEIGIVVDQQHANPGNACHGGMLSTLADIILSSAAQYQTDIPRQFLPTISMQVDFLSAAPVGSFVCGRADILKVTKNLVFSQGLLRVDEAIIARASGVFRRGPLLPDTAADHQLVLPGMPQRVRNGGSQ
jgi:uncharacterized protein (TIGR00369 family)